MTFRSSKDLIGSSLSATDGEFGKCKDFLFDDEFWTVRYLVADTGKWLPGRQVLISPISIGEQIPGGGSIQVRMSKEEIENGPPLDEHVPVGRQYEQRWAQHYGYGYYWAGGLSWGATAVPWELANVAPPGAPIEDTEGDPHLRSANEVRGYDIQTPTGAIGTSHSFIMDDKSWTIRYLVVDTGHWLPGRKVLVSPEWVHSIDWRERQVKVDMDRETIRRSPELDPDMLDRECENMLYDFYGRPRYWEHTERHVVGQP